jgi:hypothetical protein
MMTNFDGKADPPLLQLLRPAQQAAADQRAQAEGHDGGDVAGALPERAAGADGERHQQQVAGHHLGEHPTQRKETVVTSVSRSFALSRNGGACSFWSATIAD